ncbi:DUF1707 SHOCT-like domain-containing protein [Corynebacterium sp. Marseille-P8863]|uniref:DUF1707 SHOCT-like domain-containing protein n=1 Tax=Corynebacterium sp. Marseille-P8863 TaxID=2866576 RepID=UPI0022642C38|nr:DUF1707 domain-containing protein [Corynebacterium sp. Marseille-P8863]
MSSAFQPTQPEHIRLSDADRTEAMSALGEALSEGRLTLGEYDERCQCCTQAQTRADLVPLFADIPQAPVMGSSAGMPAAQHDVPVFTARELVEARRSGRRTRAGIFWLGTIGSITLAAAASLPAVLVVIPVLFILLYVMKVGPDSWYSPSLRDMERSKRRLVRAKQLELEADRAYDAARRKAERREQIDQLTGDTLNFAQESLNRFRRRD